MCDVLVTVTQAVGVVVRGVDTPLLSRVGVGGVLYAVRHKVPHIRVGTGKITHIRVEGKQQRGGGRDGSYLVRSHFIRRQTAPSG